MGQLYQRVLREVEPFKYNIDYYVLCPLAWGFKDSIMRKPIYDDCILRESTNKTFCVFCKGNTCSHSSVIRKPFTEDDIILFETIFYNDNSWCPYPYNGREGTIVASSECIKCAYYIDRDDKEKALMCCYRNKKRIVSILR